MNRNIWIIFGAFLSFCLFAFLYFTVKIHDEIEARNEIKLGYYDALKVVATRNYDSKEEQALKKQLKQKTSQDIHIYYSPKQQNLAPYIVEALKTARAENQRLIGDYPTPSLDLILFENSEQFYEFSQIKYTNGYYSDFEKIIGILPVDLADESTMESKKQLIDYMVMHEYSHYALLQKIQAMGVQGNVPEWFLEGYAEYISFIHAEPDPLDILIPFENLEESQQWTHLRSAGAADIYSQSKEAVASLIKEYGHSIIIDLLKETKSKETFEEALEQTTGLDYDELEARLSS